MKLHTLLTGGAWLLILSKAASAMPTIPLSATLTTTVAQLEPTESEHGNLEERVPHQDAVEDQTDNYLFNMTLESFISLRDERYPSYFFWESDGCSQSPDAPFGFPFLPACYRHDFGYDQYKRVPRITLSLSNIVHAPSRLPTPLFDNIAPRYHIIFLESMLTMCATARQIHD